MANPRFKIETGPEAGKELELNQPEATFGRDPGADWRLVSHQISRRHARVFLYEGVLWIEDLGSSNGTFVNGDPISDPVRLMDNDLVQLGDEVMIRLLPDGGGQAPDLEPMPEPAFEFDFLEDNATLFGVEPLNKDASEKPQLVVQIPGQRTQTFVLNRPAMSLGRAPDNDLVLSSPLISRYHGTLEQTSTGYRLVIKPTATNPLLYRGVPITGSLELHDGDVLRVKGLEPGTTVSLTYKWPVETAVRSFTKKIDFKGKKILRFGRDPENDVVLPALSVSRVHAELEKAGQRYLVKDLNSVNGTFVNNQRVQSPTWLNNGDLLEIGPFRFVMETDHLNKLNESGGQRIAALGLNHWLKNGQNLLQNLSLVIEPYTMVCIAGQPGSGAAELLQALAGWQPVTHGEILYNGMRLLRNAELFHPLMAYVPAEDFTLPGLTVLETLEYAARLRMPQPTQKLQPDPGTQPEPDLQPGRLAEYTQKAIEVLNEMGLFEEKDLLVDTLSPTRRRVLCIAAELVNNPPLLFVEAPLEGWIPGEEFALIQLLRRLADQGRTVIYHGNLGRSTVLADHLIMLVESGHLAWYGKPEDALKHFDAYRLEKEKRAVPFTLDDLYAVLADPSLGTPADWAKRYRASPVYQLLVVEPLRQMGLDVEQAPTPAPPLPGLWSRLAASAQWQNIRQTFHQAVVLADRSFKISLRSQSHLLLALAPAPAAALLNFVAALYLGRTAFQYASGSMSAALMAVFVVLFFALVAGSLSTLRFLDRESAAFHRERWGLVNPVSVLLSRFWPVTGLAFYQAILLTLSLDLAYQFAATALEIILIFITLFLFSGAALIGGVFASSLAARQKPRPSRLAAPFVMLLLVGFQVMMAGVLLPLPGWLSVVSPVHWGFQSLVAVSGAGSDVAADACWLLPEPERGTLEKKDRMNCQCMGSNVLRQSACDFPGLGRFYHPAIDQPEPPPPGRPNTELPLPPANLTDPVASAMYLETLKTFLAQTTAYEAALSAYVQSHSDWTANRNQAAGLAEAEIAHYQQDFGWAFVDKASPPAIWGSLFLAWGMLFFLSVGMVGASLWVLNRRPA